MGKFLFNSLLFLLGAAPAALFAQHEACGNHGENAPSESFFTCTGGTGKYRPDTVGYARFTPVREVRIAFYVFLKDSLNPEGVNPSNSAEVAALRDSITKYLNEPMQNAVLPVWPDTLIDIRRAALDSCSQLPYYDYTNPHIPDTRIRFVLDSIVYVYDSTMWLFGGTDTCEWTSQAQVDNFGDTLNTQLWNSSNPALAALARRTYSVFIPCGCERLSGLAAGYGTSGDKNWNVNYNIWNEMQNFLYWDPGNTFSLRKAAALIRHELGHNLNLYHSSINDNCDDTPYSYFYKPPPNARDYYCYGNTSNTTMDYPPPFYAYPSIQVQSAFTWDQMGRMHQYLTSQILDQPHHAIVPTHCTVSDTAAWVLPGEDITLQHRLVLDRDIDIRPGAVCTLKCILYMPEDGRIIVREGGRLVIDGGIVTNLCGTMWGGIFVHGNPNASQTWANQGVVEFINGAYIEEAYTGVEADSGAIVLTDQASFYNCRRGIVFRPYHNRSTYPSGTVLANVSEIKNTNFFVTDTLRDPYLSFYGNPLAPVFITADEVEGIQIWYNQFKNESPAMYTYTYGDTNALGVGITGTYTGLDINGNIFENLSRGVQLTYSGTANFANALELNEFNNVVDGVEIFGTAYDLVLNNTYSVDTAGWPHTAIGWPPPPWAWGISSVGTIYNEIVNNTVESNYIGAYANGITTVDAYDGLVAGNQISDFFIACLSEGDNAGTQVVCNRFADNYFDIAFNGIYDVDYSNDYPPVFGTAGTSAGNEFTTGCIGDYGHIWQGQALYHEAYYYTHGSDLDPPSNGGSPYDCVENQVNMPTSSAANTCVGYLYSDKRGSGGPDFEADLEALPALRQAYLAGRAPAARRAYDVVFHRVMRAMTGDTARQALFESMLLLRDEPEFTRLNAQRAVMRGQGLGHLSARLSSLPAREAALLEAMETLRQNPSSTTALAAARQYANDTASWASHAAHALLARHTENYNWLVLPTPTLLLEGAEGNKWGAAVDAPAAPAFTLYPNPTTGELRLSNPLENAGNVVARDLAGRLVQQVPLQKGASSFRLELPAGLYLIEVSAPGFRHVQRVVVN